MERIRAALEAHRREGPAAAEELYRAALAAGDGLRGEARAATVDWLAIAENGLGEALLARGAALEGVRSVERAERQLELEGLRSDYRSMLLSLLGELLIELGLPGRAEEPIARALELAEPAPGARPNYGVLFNAHLRRARQYLATGRSRDAAEAIDAVRDTFDWDGAAAVIGEERRVKNLGMLDVVGGTAWMDVALTEPAEAWRAVAAFERVGDGCRELDRFSAQGRLAHLELRRGDVAAASARLRALRAGTDGSAFEVLDPKELAWLASLEARAAELAGGDTRAARESLDHAFEVLLERWRGALRPGGAGFLRYGRARLVLEQLVALGDARDALDVAIRGAAWGVLWEAFGEPLPSVEEVQRELGGEHTACLVYVVGADRFFVLAFDDGELLRFESAALRRVEEGARELMAALRQAPGQLPPGARRRRADALATWSTALADELLPHALRPWLADKSHVRIVGAEELDGLAFEALAPDGEPLGLSCSVSYLPSLPVGVALARRAPDVVAKGTRLIVAPTLTPGVRARFPSLLPIELPHAAIARLRDALGAGDGDVRSAERATVSALASARGEGVGVVHVLAHGVQDLTRELRPVLLLAPGGLHPTGQLTVEEVRDLAVPELVVLSACRAGRGSERIGDAGAAHLGGALLQAGATCAVLSGEDLLLGAAVDLAEPFHRAHRDGASVGEALRRARQALVDGGSYSDPYHWALVHAYGLDAAD